MTMRKLLATLGVSLAVATTLAADSASSDPLTLRSSVNGRIWQTVFAPSVPLRWRWAENAESATIRFVDGRTGRTIKTETVERGADGYGVASIPVPDFAKAGEILYEVSLCQMAKDVEVESATARLAYLKSCNSFDLQIDDQSAAWRCATPNRLIPYDRSWTDSTSGPVTFRAGSGSCEASVVQEGESGWLTFSPKTTLGLSSGSFDVALLSDDSAFATAVVDVFAPGFMLLLR